MSSSDSEASPKEIDELSRYSSLHTVTQQKVEWLRKDPDLKDRLQYTGTVEMITLVIINATRSPLEMQASQC